MSFRLIDDKGKPIPKGKRSSRKPAKRLERGVELHHYEFHISIPRGNGTYRDFRKRLWLPHDGETHAAARKKHLELQRLTPQTALSWEEAYRRWLDDRGTKRAATHLSGVAITMRQWIESFGPAATVEGTSLPAFVEWVAGHAAGTKGRGAQMKHGHLLAIARWCRSRGFVKEIPFEHAPKPETRMDRRRPATIQEFLDIAALLPPQMYWLWWMLGLTGMRISAACNLLESDIGESSFVVTTKGNKRVEYPMTSKIKRVIEEARAWKKSAGFDVPTLFCSHRGRSWAHYTFSEQLRKRAPDHKITPHQVRHMAGTIMAEGNLSPDIIQAGLGHDDRASAEIYIDQTRAMRKTALAAVSDALDNIQILSKSDTENDNEIILANSEASFRIPKSTVVACPRCGHKHRINNMLNPQPIKAAASKKKSAK